MAEATLNVSLIDQSITPEATVYAAARRCYSDDLTEDLLDKAYSLDASEMASYLHGVLGKGHLSVLEHSYFTFAIEGVSRALLAQLTRHRIASFSVLSQRYVKLNGGFDYIIPETIAANPVLKDRFERIMGEIGAFYDELIAYVPAEDARAVLPMATETKLIMTMNGRELLHFFALRCCERAQSEIRELAYKMLDLVNQAAPMLFQNAGPSCVQTGVCPEGMKNCPRLKHIEGDANGAERDDEAHNDAA